ncbi:DEAD/DEAH box helicase family protein [Pantanalinema rosaneae CENA516]|uniref:DEAD/DEAH box helicase family protein n=1 Tax=Pantanalinema rosaneae TaxID=1620701 RepID=UPI003D7012A4
MQDTEHVDQVVVRYSGEIQVSPGHNPKSLYQHQIQAIQALDSKTSAGCRGLLVLPTGGGKTLTAVNWLLRNFVAKHIKVLWIAHRHELLDQAFWTIKDNAYSALLGHRENFRYRIISGHPKHDRPVNIRANDDVIIASKDSLNSGLDYLDQWLKGSNEILLVIDEAHHATAKTYRKLVAALEAKLDTKRKNNLKILGLTATPFRTNDQEKGLLKQVFPSDILFKEDLRNLIVKGTLAEPVFEELSTNITLSSHLTAADIKKIETFDSLPESVAKEIAENSQRNHLIVNHYINNREKYKQLLVFAVNITQAIALNALFKQYQNKGVKSEIIVSNLVDIATGASISKEENSKRIEQFRQGEINVLINVNILTEGTDLPNVQTVFLTRPTTSVTLMTQMIGRALRGQKSGGTEKAYIVSFIDDWENKVNWVNPEILVDGSVPGSSPGDPNKKIARLISIEKIEEFARIINGGLDIGNATFISRIPVGIYHFSILKNPDKLGDSIDKNYEVLVYNDSEQAYDSFINDLEDLFDEFSIDEEYLTQEEIDELVDYVEKNYFPNHSTLIGYRSDDIENVLQFYAQNLVKPNFISFDQRHKCDLEKVARYISEKDLSRKAQTEYEDSLWNDDSQFWQVLFGYNKRYFQGMLDKEIRKITSTSEPSIETPMPVVIYDPIPITHLTLAEIKEINLAHYRQLRNSVYAKHTDENGFITCAKTGYKSRRRIDFQIDHIKPMWKGGLSTLNNLQILSRPAHVEKTRQDRLLGVVDGSISQFRIGQKVIVDSPKHPYHGCIGLVCEQPRKQSASGQVFIEVIFDSQISKKTQELPLRGTYVFKEESLKPSRSSVIP